MYALYGHPRYSKFKQKYQQNGRVFRLSFRFLWPWKNLVKWHCLLFLIVLTKYFSIACILCVLPFSQGSFSLIHFDRNWFLKDIDICKKEVIHDLLLNFNLFSDTFFRGAQVSSKDSTFRKVLFDFSMFVLDESTKLSHSTEK